MFLFKKACRHEHISASVKSGYCPDCGEYFENHWYVARCPICGKRHKTVLKKGKPVPAETFCSSCGCQDFILEEIDFPDIVTINYAVYKTEIIKQKPTEVINAWVENTGKIKFLTLMPA